MTPIPDADVRAELDRILASKGFSATGRLSKLLRYVVDKTLAGETNQLKEYAVGVEVFDRDQRYDPRLDSIVRVEAGRLRSRLDEYYNGEGGESPIRIVLPRGGYSAQFERRQAAPVAVQKAAVPRPHHSRASIPIVAVLLIAVAGLIWVIWPREQPVDPRPTVAVLPFEANMIGGDEVTPRYLVEAVTSELTRLGTINVAAYTSAMRFEGQKLSSKELSAALNSKYLVEASIDDEGGVMLVVARLVNGETERKLWVSDYRGDISEVRAIAQRMAFDINAELMNGGAP